MKDDSNYSDVYDFLNESEILSILERDKWELELERRIDSMVKGGNVKGKVARDEFNQIAKKYYEFANDLVEQGKYYEAVDLYSRSIQISRRYLRRKAQDAIFNRAITVAMMGFPILALQDLRTILRCKPAKADLFYVMGQIYESLDKKWLAKRMYEKSLSIDPNYWRAKNSLERRDS